MASYQWIKLYDEILDDPKMGRLSDGAYRFCINLFLLASRHPSRDGSLPELDDIAWMLRLSNDMAQSHLGELIRAGIAVSDERGTVIAKFAERQGAVDVTERMRQYRDRKQKTVKPVTPDVTQENETGYEDVTHRNADIDIDKTRRERDKSKYIAPLPEPVALMISAIAQISGVTYADHLNGKQFEDTAYALIGNDISPDDLPLFAAWWATNGHYSGKPAIKSILTKIKAAKDSGWVNLPAASSNGANGHGYKRPEINDPTMPKPGQGGVW